MQQTTLWHGTLPSAVAPLQMPVFKELDTWYTKSWRFVSSRQQSTNSGDGDSSARSLASDRPDNVIQTTSILQSKDRITTEHRQNYERIIGDY